MWETRLLTLLLKADAARTLRTRDRTGKGQCIDIALYESVFRLLDELAPAYAKSASGKALARESEKLDFAARCVGVTQPSSLLSESQAALIAQLKEEGFDPSKMRLPPEQWYPAADGLKVLRALIEYVDANLNKFKQPNPILRDLKAAEALLSAADAAGVRFHFTKANL